MVPGIEVQKAEHFELIAQERVPEDPKHVSRLPNGLERPQYALSRYRPRFSQQAFFLVDLKVRLVLDDTFPQSSPLHGDFPAPRRGASD